MLQRGDSVPHFEVTATDGTALRYSTYWQHKNLVLVALPAADRERFRSYVDSVAVQAEELAGLSTALVITHDAVTGLDAPAVLVADRWGEICFAHGASGPPDLPEPGELVEWARFLQHQCPECEGESR
jgi:peroxiredoxin